MKDDTFRGPQGSPGLRGEAGALSGLRRMELGFLQIRRSLHLFISVSLDGSAHWPMDHTEVHPEMSLLVQDVSTQYRQRRKQILEFAQLLLSKEWQFYSFNQLIHLVQCQALVSRSRDEETKSPSCTQGIPSLVAETDNLHVKPHDA